ncbi:hypothetical protein VVMO6_03547 [Vibrio vulnificus MO6-24/O]|nr:hypothetical protein VVMO6_03547 [Vibrio vulnificus MO6-24/O]
MFAKRLDARFIESDSLLPNWYAKSFGYWYLLEGCYASLLLTEQA